MKPVLVTLGMAHSGTNLLKNMFNDLFNKQNKYPCSYTYLGHAETKNGYLDMNVNVLDNIHGRILTVIFNYRNEFDRNLSSVIRRHFKDRKGADQGGKKVDILEHKDEIGDIVVDLLNDTDTLNQVHTKYGRVLAIKDKLTKKCKTLNTSCTVLTYEGFYENFDYIFDNLKRFNIQVSAPDLKSMKFKHSANSAYNISRSGTKEDVMKRYGLLSNHVSHSKGEPYFWTKFIDFDAVFKSLPDENKELLKKLTENHPHSNLRING